MSQYLRLVDFAANCKDPIQRAAIFDLVKTGSVMARDIPFKVQHSLVTAGSRIKDLPEITWKDLNDENITGEHSVPQPFTESAFAFRQLVKTDILEDSSEDQVTNTHGQSCEAYLKSFAREFNRVFINGNHRVGGTANALVGLKERLDFPTTYGTLAANNISASSLDMTTGTGTAAALADLVEALNELLWSVGSETGDGVIIYADRKFLGRLDRQVSLFSGQGGFSTGVDQIGRTVRTFRGARFEEIGTEVDQATAIIGVTEAADGSTDTDGGHTSLYAVNYAPGYCSGWTHAQLGVHNVPDGDSGILRKSLIQWCGGLFMQSERSIARLKGIKYS